MLAQVNRLVLYLEYSKWREHMPPYLTLNTAFRPRLSVKYGGYWLVILNRGICELSMSAQEYMVYTPYTKNKLENKR